MKTTRQRQTVDMGGATVVLSGSCVESIRPFDTGCAAREDDRQPFQFRGQVIWASNAYELGRGIARLFGKVALRQEDYEGLDLEGEALTFARGQIAAGMEAS